MTELLRIENLTITPKAEPGRALVSQVSFALEAGKTTCIVGESGSGKSLTALAVMGLLSDQLQLGQGNIVFKGFNITHASHAELQRIRGKEIGMIFQEPMTSLNPVLTIGYQIGESLAQHLKLTGAALKARVADLLQQVGIPPERAGSYPDELSGGQRQRVMIAMSIACEPAMLIADEPTTALDVTVQAQILKLLDDLKTRMHMGMLFITHDFGVVTDIADNVVVMFRGEIVESGPVQDVLLNPRHPYTRALLDCVPDADGKKPLKPIDYAWLNAGAA
ncbi:peptide/nickel transport system ATP-binding protein [Methylobacillus rhizosphaerae]|uniref:Peptide/nickel transport system ATP-binding protein n=1 Tax=Methylobacillus rhizosphaerae TaxID=551994 RepID=A0A238YM79_9PROT|nr:ABC transporter ATP-binding protein [Methylobacillus rhizosphaerae]SNR71744.1 peptide/nickel transport system ATP-binding protein [Methylobacillus rhizosphaerae]